MHEPEALDAERVFKARPDAAVVVHEVVSGGKNVAGVDAYSDTVAEWRPNPIDQRRQLLERRAKRRSGTRRCFEQQPRPTWDQLERNGDRVGVSRETTLTVVHVVAGVRNKQVEIQRA